jgi:hypothetical protein
MPISLPVAIIGGAVASAGIGAAGSLAAAGTQASAGKNAAQLQYMLGQQQLQQNQNQFNTTQANEAPWLRAGTSAIGTLSNLLSTPGSGLLTPWTSTFAAPTVAQAQATPGYQFTAGAGSGAIQNSAAGSGNLLSTGTLKTLDQFNQGLASTTYQQTYQNAFNEYLQQYNQFQNNQTNEFNRLASVSGLGQQAATSLGQLGQQNANTNASISGTIGGQVGNSLLYTGAANASGYAGVANALSGGINNLSQYALLNSILNPQGAGPTGGIPGLAPGTNPGDTTAGILSGPAFAPSNGIPE